MSESPLGLVARLAVVLLAAGLARVRPQWLVPTLLALVPLQLGAFSDVDLATLAVVGGVAARAPEILAMVARQPLAIAALGLFPLWIVASTFWARQPTFVADLLGKWLTLVAAALLATVHRERDPRPIVVGALAGAVPAALWALGERLHLIAPRGDPRLLEQQLIRYGDLVRGRALFHHPNKLAEYLEQVGLLLAAVGFGGMLPLACLAGFAVALAGVWGTNSMGALGIFAGGGVVLAAVAARPQSLWRYRRWLVAAAVVAAAVMGWYAFRAHGGLGSRSIVYEFALEVISHQPWLGLGGGNWSLAVGSAPSSVSRFWFQSHPHSLYLMIVAELGVVGLGLAAVFFGVPLWIALQRIAETPLDWRPVRIGAIAAVVAILCHGFVNYFLRYPVNGITTGVMLGLALGGGWRASDR
jgi:hypothetical protein